MSVRRKPSLSHKGASSDNNDCMGNKVSSSAKPLNAPPPFGMVFVDKHKAEEAVKAFVIDAGSGKKRNRAQSHLKSAQKPPGCRPISGCRNDGELQKQSVAQSESSPPESVKKLSLKKGSCLPSPFRRLRNSQELEISAHKRPLKQTLLSSYATSEASPPERGPRCVSSGSSVPVAKRARAESKPRNSCEDVSVVDSEADKKVKRASKISRGKSSSSVQQSGKVLLYLKFYPDEKEDEKSEKGDEKGSESSESLEEMETSHGEEGIRGIEGGQEVKCDGGVDAATVTEEGRGDGATGGQKVKDVTNLLLEDKVLIGGLADYQTQMEQWKNVEKPKLEKLCVKASPSECTTIPEGHASDPSESEIRSGDEKKESETVSGRRASRNIRINYYPWLHRASWPLKAPGECVEENPRMMRREKLRLRSLLIGGEDSPCPSNQQPIKGQESDQGPAVEAEEGWAKPMRRRPFCRGCEKWICIDYRRFEDHVWEHLGALPYTCAKCPMRANTVSILEEHFMVAHARESALKFHFSPSKEAHVAFFEYLRWSMPSIFDEYYLIKELSVDESPQTPATVESSGRKRKRGKK